MQSLIVYYSRTGKTKIIAEELTKALQCDAEELIDTVNRKGPLGFLNSGRQAGNRSLTKLVPVKKDPSQYDIVIIGTPIWGRNMSTPVRTYLTEYKEKFKNVAFFCTEGSKGGETAFKEMGEVTGKQPRATLTVTAADLKGNYAEKVTKFAGELKA